jgi:tetratricopeptide (TPR) repeat protein
VEGVYFVGTPGVQVFPASGAIQGAVPPAAPAIDPSKYAHLAADQAVDVGDGLFARGDYGEAVAAYRAAVAKAPDDPMAVFALGHGLFAIGVLDEAAATLRRGVTLYPEIVRAHMRRRDFYGKPADYDDQMGQLLRYAATHPGDRDATFLLGYNFFYSQEPARAKAQFAQLGAGDAVARLFLAVLTPGD